MSKVLVLSATPSPFLEDHGGKQRLVKLTKSLSKQHEVTLLSLSWAGDTFDMPVDTIRHISIGVEPDVIRVARGRRTTLKKPNNDTLIGYYKKYFKKYKAKLNELADTHDIIVVDHYATGPMTENLNNKNIPIFYSSQNCETDLAKQMFPKNSEDITLINDTEKGLIDRSKAIAYCSKDDFEIMNKYFIINKPAYYIPNGNTSIPGIKPGTGIDSKSIVFIGSGHPPNVIAAEEIINLAKIVPEYNFVIAGTCVGGIDNLPTTKNVTKIKKISNDEVDEMFENAFIFINPMQSGSGTHLKMMKALGYGLPIITSTIGARGFSDEEKESCMVVADTIEDMAKAIKTISNKKKYMSMSINSLDLSAEYDWEKIGSDFVKAVENTIAENIKDATVEKIEKDDPTVKREKILLYSIVRNENKYMNYYYSKITEIVKTFPQFDFYLSIYENDSDDGTKQKLFNRDWSMFSGVSIVSENLNTENFGSVKAEARVRNLSTARNKAIEAGRFLDIVDYVMMVEADVEFEMDSVAKILNFKNTVPDFDIVSGITIRNRKLYDQWATRKQPLYDETYPLSKDYRMKAYDKYYSTSNGICLYRAEPFREGIRHGWINKVNDEFDCEMVVVCQGFHEKGYENIFIIHDAEIYHEHR